ncbi:radical SAM protein [Chitinophaga cymbidii]|uniref:Radical SAM core domain-containing protein n=1 Tax=Chitinophaga cymbidii TaxID=1096750 RepID=A0A512RQY9_9BACT|nr:radical SAM protein [Chitinophaga cymbidii]GEP98117.1 hypothetical protein CCY01nite_43770 [Chitinophaga cymbidii]
MKLRFEPQGLHYYCRRSGLHILFDEVKIEKSAFSIAPRTISIAITDKCDFSCSYCYVNLKDKFLSKNDIIKYCKQLDKLGTFDVALGGGEPTLHPDIVSICREIWLETGMGISITTHGHHLNEKFIEEIKDYVSFVRISIDGPEPIYSQLRNKKLHDLLPKLRLLKGHVPFGINTVINKLTLPYLEDVKIMLIEYGAFELLLLPMLNKGKFVLNENDWDVLNNWIERNYQVIPIRTSVDAEEFLKQPFLFSGQKQETDYGFIGIDGKYRRNSFSNEGIRIDAYNSLEQMLLSINADSLSI